MSRVTARWLFLSWLYCCLLAAPAPAAESRLLYVAAPGIRNDLRYGGAGILVFDIDRDHQFVKRIATPHSAAAQPENMKGICACAATRRLYFSTPTRLYALDLVTERTLWEKALPQGCDRMSMLPDGSVLYVPSFEKDIWNVVDGATGDVVATVEPKSGRTTRSAPDGKRMYLAGLRSPVLSIADTATHKLVAQAGPFSAAIRPFTVDGPSQRVFVCVNELLGFEIGDLQSGRVLERVAVAGFEKGPVARHGCPSHGIALSPDGRELWLCDAHNHRLHVFDVTVSPPKQVAGVEVREEPGWVTFGIDGKLVYSSTGEVIRVADRRIVTVLEDEEHRPVHSEKLLEIDFVDGVPLRAGDQFGVGRKP